MLSGLDEMANDRRTLDRSPTLWGFSVFVKLQIAVAEKSVRPSEGMAEGGCGGNSAMPSQKTEASSATLLFKARHHRKILFSLREEKIRRAQNEKSKEYFSVVWRAERAVAGLASLVPFKVGSSKVQNIPHESQNYLSYWPSWIYRQ